MTAISMFWGQESLRSPWDIIGESKSKDWLRRFWDGRTVGEGCFPPDLLDTDVLLLGIQCVGLAFEPAVERGIARKFVPVLGGDRKDDGMAVHGNARLILGTEQFFTVDKSSIHAKRIKSKKDDSLG